MSSMRDTCPGSLVWDRDKERPAFIVAFRTGLSRNVARFLQICPDDVAAEYYRLEAGYYTLVCEWRPIR